MSSTARIGRLVGFGLLPLACGAPPKTPTPAVASAAPETASSAAAGTSPAREPAPMAPAASPPEARTPGCVARGSVSRGGVIWPLRVRADAPASMTVEDGAVTAWVAARPHGSEPWTIPVELENASMKIRAVVSGEDLRFFVTKPFFARKGWVPDGVTERRVLDATDTTASLELAFEKLHTTTAEIACTDLGVMPSRLDADTLLGKAGGEVVIEATAPVHVGEETYAASAFSNPNGVARPAGTLSTERGPRDNGANQVVSIETCGGTALGAVSKGALVGQPRAMAASTPRCPGTPTGAFVAEAPLERPLRCPADLPLFLRTGASEDPVGVLKAGAKVQDEGHAENGSTLVRVRNPAAAPAKDMAFALKSSDLATCTPSK